MTETLKTPVKELTMGSTFAGRYQIIEELGHGGMGRVDIEPEIPQARGKP
jgi:serine/threonine-protein kinase